MLPESKRRPRYRDAATNTNPRKLPTDRSTSDDIGGLRYERLIEGLALRAEWPFEWLAAKLLATMPIAARRVQVLRNWTYLSAQGDIPLILETADIIRRKARETNLDRWTSFLIEKAEKRSEHTAEVSP